MGFLGSLFSSTSDQGSMPKYLQKEYEKFGLDPDHEVKGTANRGKKMYCTMCRRIYNGGVYCRDCNNILVEWK
jgi:hypothetical protein